MTNPFEGIVHRDIHDSTHDWASYEGSPRLGGLPLSAR